jgi:hypothetical protein
MVRDVNNMPLSLWSQDALPLGFGLLGFIKANVLHFGRQAKSFVA